MTFHKLDTKIMDGQQKRNKITHGTLIWGSTKLHEAASCGNCSEAKDLIEQGEIPVDAENDYGFTPLFVAKTWEMRQLLLDHGADINHRNNEKGSMMTNLRFDRDHVSKAISAGYDIHKPFLGGIYVTRWQIFFTETGPLTLLGNYIECLKHCHHIMKDDDWERYIDIIRLILESGGNPDERDYLGVIGNILFMNEAERHVEKLRDLLIVFKAC